MKVKNEVKSLETVSIDDLTELQGDLKELSEKNYEKLKKDILKLGFSEAITVWKNSGKNWILNGHQRLRTLKKMREEGIEIPLIPIQIVEAKDRNEAKRKVLSLTSQFGEMTGDGLYSFLQDTDLTANDLNDFEFSDIDTNKFIEEYYLDLPPEPKEDLETCQTCGQKIREKKS